MSNEELIAEAREPQSDPMLAVYLEAQKWGYELSTTEAAHIAEAALEAQSAPLVADSREAVIDALRQETHAPMHDHSPVDGSCTSCPWPVFMLPPEDIADALLASGVVSLAADRDRATAEAFGLWLLDIGHMPDLWRADMKQLAAQFANPYRESTERCPSCRCELAYPTALHIVDCIGFDRESEGK